MRWWRSIRPYLGLIVLAGVMLFAVFRVASNRLRYEATDGPLIRICHWQLEAGFRQALQQLIDDYEKQYFERHGQRVRVVQIPISERGFKEYVNTSLIGGNAPDILEKGQSVMARDPSYVVRYFMPLGQHVEKPNPYNEDTALAGLPWRETFFDGMQNSYDPSLLEFYYIPFSMFTLRIYYNRDLYQRLTGKDDPPQTYEELLMACQTVMRESKARGKMVLPFAGSKFQATVLRNRYETPFYFDLMHRVDSDYNADPNPAESYLSYREGLWTFRDKAFLAAWQCLSDLTRYFQDGWTAAGRDDAVFMFVQQRALMYVSGSWDAPSLKAQVGDKFAIGVFDFPMPVRHPEYGKYVIAPVSEASISGGIPWAITRQSRHPEICIDFLQYCTTQKNNKRFNTAITWLPVVRGAHLTEQLEPFRPRMEGFAVGSVLGFQYQRVGPQVNLIAEGQAEPLLSGIKSPQEYADVMTDAYAKHGRDGFLESMDKSDRGDRELERILGSEIAVGLHHGQGRDEADVRRVLRMVSVIQEGRHRSAWFRDRFKRIESREGGAP